jgi:hypothetical protein
MVMQHCLVPHQAQIIPSAKQNVVFKKNGKAFHFVDQASTDVAKLRATPPECEPYMAFDQVEKYLRYSYGEEVTLTVNLKWKQRPNLQKEKALNQ